ncbi:hypothetical protein M2S00_05065 [Apilactobacillus sp. TMW 2.2459]|uniref:hypothetical protein n=1 Tax=Apilactobacillus xinyiensis TaxID=2841032 RepID=UPI001C7D54B6|nr:hypothetical protein [Apilactobacillus xinyiensis]MCL0312474.1 hypothetical protein [Apilactobacillus xinyiensis]
MSKFIANERSEGSKLITSMNNIFYKNNWKMKNAVGELSLKSINSDNRYSTLFPDAVIFADENNNEPLIGWEFKMPDVSINDDELYRNALDKANRMGTQVFVLWNFQYAAIYIKKDNSWPTSPTKLFDSYSDILTDRKNVQQNFDVWNSQLREVLSYLNKSFISNKFKVAPIEFNISNYINTITDKLAPITAEHYLNSDDAILRKTMIYWRKNEQSELVKVSQVDNIDKTANAFSRNIIIRWINRIIFCHILKYNQNDINELLIKFSKDNDINEFSSNINAVVNKSDFYTLLHVSEDEFENYLPQIVVNNLNEFNIYLGNSDLSVKSIGTNLVSKMLEGLIDVSSRELMGLYKTPVLLAKFLVSITIKEVSGNFADVTVGSGTIAHEIQNKLLDYKKTEEYVHNHIWASDRYSYPLQIANLNMTSPESLNLKNIVYQHNALNLHTGEKIKIVNPKNGNTEHLEIPKFDYIISNLPFVDSNRRNREDSKYIDEIISKYNILDKKIDLYQAILVHLNELLNKNNENARIGVITSNSWFKVKKGYKSFYKDMVKYYDVESIIIPSYGRWFDNASVSTSIIILKNKTENLNKSTRLIKINTDLEDNSTFNDVVLSISLNKNTELYSDNTMKQTDIIKMINKGMSIESLFDDNSFIEMFDGCLSPIGKFLDGGRGTRTGGDSIFIMDKPKVDSTYCFPYLKTIKDVSKYCINSTKRYFFYTKDNIEYLKSNNKNKTLKYLESISSSTTAISRKNRKKDKWFNADQSPQYADFITSINPQDKYFWGMMTPRMAVNQRVTAFKVKDQFNSSLDKSVLHAILNSVFSQYMLASSGFGRGEGVTDLTKDGIKQIFIPDIELISFKDKLQIKALWDELKVKNVQNVFKQLNDEQWVNFNKFILKTYNIDENIFDNISHNLKSLIRRRMSSKK